VLFRSAPWAIVYLACFALPGATSFGPHAFPQVDGPLDPSLPWPARVATLHARMVGYHTYYYQGSQTSRWYEWLCARQPLWLTAWLEGPRVRVIAAIGSPLLWITGELATAALLVAGLRERCASRVLPGVLVIAQLAFWAVVLRMTLLYYMGAIVPFLALSVAGLLARSYERATDPPRAARAMAGGTVVLLSLAAAWLWYVGPLVRAAPLSEPALARYAASPAAPFLFHDELPLSRALEVVHGEGFQSARLSD
jgi:hypothetical protein